MKKLHTSIACSLTIVRVRCLAWFKTWCSLSERKLFEHAVYVGCPMQRTYCCLLIVLLLNSRRLLLYVKLLCLSWLKAWFFFKCFMNSECYVLLDWLFLYYTNYSIDGFKNVVLWILACYLLCMIIRLFLNIACSLYCLRTGCSC